MPGKGMPSLRGGKRGNQYVTLFVEVPKTLSSEQKELLQRYAETFTGKKQKNEAYPKYASFLDHAKKFLGID